VSFDSESFRDQNDVDVKSKKNEKNAEKKNADEKKISLNSSFNSFNSFSEFFSSDEKKIASITTSSQRRVVSKSTFDSIFDEVFDDRRKRRSKKENDRFLTKKTSNRHSNVVVAQNFNRFCFVV
jgi:hypothetical protein